MERKNEMGVMKINDNLFGAIVTEAVRRMKGKAFIASEKGKLLTGLGGSRPTISEITDNIVVKDEEGRIYLACYLIVSFGSSIRQITEDMSTYLQERLQSMFPDCPGKVKIKVVGVRSRYIAPRDIVIEKEWS